MDNILGDRLFKLRKSQHLTQKAVAEALNLTPQAIGQWESGIRQPRLKELVKIARFYGVTTDYLLGVEGKKDQAVPDLEASQTLAFKGRRLSKEDISIIRNLLSWHYNTKKGAQ